MLTALLPSRYKAGPAGCAGLCVADERHPQRKTPAPRERPGVLMKWWSRGESNPRPQTFARQIYMLS